MEAITRLKVPAASVVEIRITPADPEEDGGDGDQLRRATTASIVVPQLARSCGVPGLPTVAEADEVPIACFRGRHSDVGSSVRRTASQKAKGTDPSKMRPPPLRRTRSRSLDSCDSPPTPRSGYTTDSERHQAGANPTDPSSFHASAALDFDERRARAATIGAGGLKGLERLTSQLESERAMRDRLAAKSATSSGFPASPNSPASSVSEALKRSALRSGTPDVEALVANASRAEEAARFRMQRRAPPPPRMPPLTLAVDPTAPAPSATIEHIKRATNPICNVLEKVTNIVGNCKLAPSSSKDEGRSEGKEVMKTVEKMVTVVELDSQAIAREDDARFSSQSPGSERSRFTDRSAPTTRSTSVGSGSGEGMGSEGCMTAKALTSGGYDSVVSGVTMAQAVNNGHLNIRSAVPLMPRV